MERPEIRVLWALLPKPVQRVLGTGRVSLEELRDEVVDEQGFPAVQEEVELHGLPAPGPRPRVHEPVIGSIPLPVRARAPR